MKRIASFALALGLIGLIAPNANAEKGPWEFTLTPYAWMAGLSGDLTVGDLEVPVDVSFGDVLEDLEIGFIGHLEASNDQWAVFTDIVYLELGRGVNNLDFDLTETIWESGLGYRLTENFEVIGGVRYWSIDSAVARTVEPKIARDADKSWVEPMIGGRYRVPLSERLSLGLRGDIGGFGAGSDFAWSTSGFLDYKVAKWFSLLAGYKALGVNYEDEGDDESRFFKYDVITHGPAIAGTFRF